MSALPYICEVICSNRSTSAEKRGVDTDKLINEVRNRPGLWDQTSSDYGNRPLKVKLWRSVAAELNRTVIDVKGRWKSLKDSFNREIRNIARSGHNSTKWVHFDQMAFILEGSNSLLLPRLSESDSGYLSQSLAETDTDIQNTPSNSYDNELSENSFPATEEEQEIHTPGKKRLKICHMPLSSEANSPNPVQINTQTNCGESTPSPCRPDKSNEDYYFLMSLLPTFERLSPKQKMLVKIKLMQDMYEAAFKEESSDVNNS